MSLNRGSEWSRWDLHIHTPLSINNTYGGDKDEIWETFISTLEKLPPDVKVIGINDYYFIDGYEKVMAFKKAGRLSNILKIFPVIEFRIDTFASAGGFNDFSKINLHVLFDVDETDLSNEIKLIKERFIEQLKVSSLPIHKTVSLTRENLINESPGGTLASGFAHLIPSTSALIELINDEYWRTRTFVFIGYSE